MMTALYAKKKASSAHHGEIFSAFLTHNYNKFMNSYQLWLDQNAETLLEDCLPLEVTNKAFNFLFGEGDERNVYHSDHKLDYNFIVDQVILLISSYSAIQLEDEHVRREVHTTKAIDVDFEKYCIGKVDNGGEKNLISNESGKNFSNDLDPVLEKTKSNK